MMFDYGVKMIGLQLVPAQTFSMAQLATLVSCAYADYYYHVAVTDQQLEQICREMDVHLSESVVALLGGDPVGIALLSCRGSRGWISAVGVLRGFRRLGIASEMVRYLQRRAKAFGLHRVTLEVLVKNRPALALYGQLGFSRARDLSLLVLEPKTYVPGAGTLPAITEAKPSSLLADFDVFHPVMPSWQRELATLRHRLDYLTGLAVVKEGEVIGYVLFQALPSHFSVHDLAVLPSAVQPLVIAEHLLRSVHQRSSALGGYVVNAVLEDPLLPAFRALGYRTIHRQVELLWELEH